MMFLRSVIVFVLMVSVGICAAAWYAMRQPPAYLSQGRMMVMGQIHAGNEAASKEERENFLGTQVELMKSADLRTRAHARVQSLHPDLNIDPDVELEVGQLPKTSIFLMRTIGKSKEYTQAYLDACMDAYIAAKKAMREDQVMSAQATMSDEVVRLEEMLKKHEYERRAFVKANDLDSLQREANAAGSYLAQLYQQLAELKTGYDLMSLFDLEQTLELSQIAPHLIATNSKEHGSGASAAAMQYYNAKKKLSELAYQRRELKGGISGTEPKKPSTTAIDEEIGRVELMLKAYNEQWIEATKAKRAAMAILIKGVEGAIRDWEKKALDLAGRIGDYDKIKSTIERTKSHYDRLKASLGSVDGTNNTQSDLVSILERATPALSVRPALDKLLILGAGGGSLLALPILFIMFVIASQKKKEVAETLRADAS